MLEQQPVRIVGAAGSGKTLLMMLLAISRLRLAENNKIDRRILYVVHNSAMQNTVWNRFVDLGAERFLEGNKQRLEVQTLFEYSRNTLGIEDTPVLYPDAYESNIFQQQLVQTALRMVLTDLKEDPESLIPPLFEQALKNESVFGILSYLISDEIAVAIKGHGLVTDANRYIESERRLSRFHGSLSHDERSLVYRVFQFYYKVIFEEMEVFDSDDLALSLLARLRSPLWEMRRRKLGFDHVFVDETQLFNENERKLFPLLTKGNLKHIPIVLALDEAQQTRATTSAGFGLLGLDALIDENLTVVHRSIASILALAFFVIQRTTDLFGADFPDFTNHTTSVIPDSHRLAGPPSLVTVSEDSNSIGRAVVKQINVLRKQNFRQIGVICHAERHWKQLLDTFRELGRPVFILTQRGQRIDNQHPVIVLARPDSVGGQEFEAVISVGLEQGVVPAKVDGNEALSAVLEQQSLREMYVCFTRARYRLIVLNAARSVPTDVLRIALESNLLTRGGMAASR